MVARWCAGDSYQQPTQFIDEHVQLGALGGTAVTADSWSAAGALQRLVPLDTGEFVVRATYAPGAAGDPGMATTTGDTAP